MKDETTNTSATPKPLREDRPRAERRDADLFRAPAGHQDCHAQQQQDRDLGDHAEPENRAAERDVALAAQIDRRPETEGKDPPCDVRSAVRRYDGVREEPEQGVYCDIDGVVGGECDQRAGNAERPAQSRRDIRIEAAGAGDEAVHRGEANAEQQVQHPDKKKRAGDARPVAECKCRRRYADDRGERGCGRDDKKHHMGYSDRLAPQLVRRLSSHRHPVFHARGNTVAATLCCTTSSA